MYDVDQQELKLEEMEDTVQFEVEQFNRKVISEPFNRAVLNKLTDYVDPTSKENVNFAVNDAHADTIVRLLKRLTKSVVMKWKMMLL